MKKFLQSETIKIILACLWFVLVAIPIGFMMGQHQAFKSYTKTTDLAIFKKNLTAKFTTLHLIGSDCLCSQKLSDYLIQRKPLKAIEELILIVGNNHLLKQKFISAGFNVEEISPKLAASKYSIKALPQMIVYDERNTTLYSGGYTNKRAPASSEDYDDLKIIEQVTHGYSQTERPVFGCANGRDFRNKMDPIGIKY